MHSANFAFLTEMQEKYPKYFSNCRVLEIGSCTSWNGLPPAFRKYFDAQEYIGIDLIDGEGVDIVTKAQATDFPQDYFDTIVCFSVFEHDPGWQETLAHNLPFVKDGGMLFLAWGADGNPPHGPFPFAEVKERDFLDFVKTLPVTVLESFFEYTRYQGHVGGGYCAVLQVERHK